MTKVTIERELLERIDETAICDGTDATISDDLFTRLVAALAAPRQPDGEGLEVVAYQSIDATRGGGWMAHKHALPQAHIDQGALQEPLCRLSDAQRAIAELREVNRIQLEIAEVHGAACVEIRKERDTLRQQLAERDAEIERLRVQLLAIFSAEPGRHNIEWAKAMAATGNNEAYAKWREAFDQRDKLAGLLREVRVIVAREVERWTRASEILPVTARVESGLLTRIDAALAEVTP